MGEGDVTYLKLFMVYELTNPFLYSCSDFHILFVGINVSHYLPAFYMSNSVNIFHRLAVIDNERH